MKKKECNFEARNIVGVRVRQLRKAKGMKQKDFWALLQSIGMDISLTGLSRLEGQQRSVNDYELVYISKALEVSVEELLKD